jgi:chromosome segregation ATPase
LTSDPTSYLIPDSFITLLQNPNHFVLQFFEKRSLKNLVHLFLHVQEASPAIIMYHMNITLTRSKDELATLTSQNNFLQNEVNKRDFHIQESQTEIAALKNKIAENENMILHRNTEEIKRLNQEIKNIETNREYEENRLKTLVKTYEAKVDQLTRDNFAINEKLQ